MLLEINSISQASNSRHRTWYALRHWFLPRTCCAGTVSKETEGKGKGSNLCGATELTGGKAGRRVLLSTHLRGTLWLLAVTGEGTAAQGDQTLPSSTAGHWLRGWARLWGCVSLSHRQPPVYVLLLIVLLQCSSFFTSEKGVTDFLGFLWIPRWQGLRLFYLLFCLHRLE